MRILQEPPPNPVGMEGLYALTNPATYHRELAASACLLVSCPQSLSVCDPAYGAIPALRRTEYGSAKALWGGRFLPTLLFR
jgi:hypothetical protein